jgi:proteasome lid subunit RPN8/RPN11
LRRTRDALTEFALAGLSDGGHEGIAYWAGRRSDEITVYVSVLIPVAKHSPGGVFVSPQEIGRLAKEARSHGLAVLAQIHSHPGADARHSDGDDQLVLMPFEGMLSIVVPNYGVRLSGIGDLTVHQWQDGKWILTEPESHQLVVAPEVIDLR